ncbi:MAG: fibronectin type III domain-containing protein [Saprospiraceae bacterium]
MKNFIFWSVSTLQLGGIISVLTLFSFNLNGQCSCGPNPDVYPTGQNHHYYPVFDANGFVTSYSYQFQFPCMGDPLALEGQYEYKVIYREKGTTPWTILGGLETSIFSGDPIFTNLLIGVGNLKPCKVYEFRVTCPDCLLEPSCNSQIQLNAYLSDEVNNALGNVTSIWEVCYSPIVGQKINNFILSSTNMNYGTVNLTWDHLPAQATYQIDYRPKNSFNWITVGTTNINKFELHNLEPCVEYTVRVRGSIENCCGDVQYSQFASFDFVLTDCMSNIRSVDFVTGNSAHVIWEPLHSAPGPYEYELRWWKFPNAPYTSTTITETNHTITGLQPYTLYAVQVFSKCEPQICPLDGYSKKHTFYTNCELNEPNNNFLTATPVSFDANHSNVNITPAGDVDFFKFTPTVCKVEVKIDRPGYDEIVNLFNHCYVVTGFPYTLYDQHYQEVAKSPSYIDSQGCIHENTYWVNPGEEYYLAIKGLSNTYKNLDCYTFNVFPCLGCETPSNLFIDGANKIYSIPKTGIYGLSKIVQQVEWSVTGPADLSNTPYPTICELAFYDIGTVVLTATITDCDGTTTIVQKEIIVSDECNIVGSYTNSHLGSSLSQGFNFISGSNYTIELDLPDGISFNVYPNGGNVNWVIDGNKIIMTQPGSYASIRIALSGGNCNAEQGIYRFLKWPVGPLMPLVEWTLSPNPTSNLLQITPVISPEVDPNTIPASVDIRLFNQNSNLVISQLGVTTTPTSLNLANLQPGSYSLQLLYGEYWQQYTVVKQ